MAILDEFSKESLDKVIDNVVSCLPLIENMFKDQDNEFRKEIGIMTGFVLLAMYVVSIGLQFFMNS